VTNPPDGLSNSDTIPEVRRVSKSFASDGRERLVLRDASLAVRPGEVLAVIGPMSAGPPEAPGPGEDHLAAVRPAWVLPPHPVPPIKPIPRFQARRANDLWQTDLIGKDPVPEDRLLSSHLAEGRPLALPAGGKLRAESPQSLRLCLPLPGLHAVRLAEGDPCYFCVAEYWSC